MKPEFIITLFNSQTKEYIAKQERFHTFEEASMFANKERHKLGHHWATISIVRDMKRGNCVSRA